MRTDLAARLGQTHWSLHPLWELAPRVDSKNEFQMENNLLSLSYGRIVRKNINEVGGLRPGTYETYNIIEPGDTILRMTDLQNDQRSIRTGLSTERGIITSAYITVRPNCSKVEPRFLHSVLRSYDIKKTFYEMGAGIRQTLKYAELADLPIPLPPLDTQRAIADYLDRETGEIDAMIAKMDELTETLGGRRQAVIVGAVLGIAPNEQARETKRSTLPWVDRIPADWDERTLGTVTWVRARLGWKGLTASEYVDSGVPMLATPDIKQPVLDFASAARITDERFDESPEIKLSIGDVLLTKDGATIGIVNVVRDLPEPATVNGSIAVITPNDGLDSTFLYWVIASTYAQSIFRQLQSGMGVPHLFQRDINRIRIPVPSLAEQRRIADHLDEVTGKIDAMLAKVAELKALLIERRAALITDVVTGRKKVA